jgi:hypothetical protein
VVRRCDSGQVDSRRSGAALVVVTLVICAVAAVVAIVIALEVSKRNTEQEAVTAAKITALEKDLADAAARAAAIPPPPAVVTQVLAMIPMPNGTVVTQLVTTGTAGGIEQTGRAFEPVSLVMTQLIMAAQAMDRQQQGLAVLSQRVGVVSVQLDGLSNNVYREVATQREETRQEFARTHSVVGQLGGRVGDLQTNTVALEDWLGGTFRATAEAGMPSFAGELDRNIRETGEALSSLRAQENTLRDAKRMTDAIRHALIGRRIRQKEAKLAELKLKWEETVAPWVRVRDANTSRLSSLPTLVPANK